MSELKRIKYESSVSLLYGYEIQHDYDEEYDEEIEPTFKWDPKLGTLYYFEVDYAGTTSECSATVVGILLGGPENLHYSTCVTTRLPNVNDAVMMNKFLEMNKNIIKYKNKGSLEPKLIVLGMSGR